MRFVWLALVMAFANPVFGMQSVNTKSEFVDLVSGRDLLSRLYRITLNVNPDGTINGRALGRDVTGDWIWNDGYFCRTMYWGKREIPYNCQLVEFDGRKLRFTTEKGTGYSADFFVQ